MASRSTGSSSTPTAGASRLAMRGTSIGLGRILAPATLVIALLAVGAGAGPEPQRAAAFASRQQAPALFDETVLRDLRLTFDDADWETRLQRIADGEHVLADLEFEGETYVDVGLSIKGNSSARGSGRKVPLNLSMDAEVKGQDLWGYDTLNLNSGFMNPTYTREIMTLAQLRAVQPMPKASYVRVFANGAYFGLYTLVQQIEGTFVDEWFGGGGMLFKGDAPGGGGGGPGSFRSDLSWLGEDLAGYRSNYELKSAPDEEEALTALRELTRVLGAPVSEGGASDEDFAAAIDDVLDVDNVLWYLASINLFTNYDSYYAGHNFFLYRPDADGRFRILSWDVNESFGLFPGAGIRPEDSEAVATTDPFLMATGGQASQRPLVSRLLTVPAFRADFLAHYRTLRDAVFAPEALEAAITGYQALISDAVRDDPNKIYTFDDFTRGVWQDLRIGGGGGGPGGGGRSAPGIMKVATRRHAWLGERADFAAPDHQLAEHRRVPELPTSADAPRVELRFAGADLVAEVELVVSVERGRPTRLSMAEAGGVWSAGLPAGARNDDVSYYARVTFDDGRTAFHPALNQTQPWTYKVAGVTLPEAQTGALVINELMADNETTIADPAEEFDDWVELHNRGDEAIALEGYFLSDNPEDPFAFALPALQLPAGGHLLIWCDNDPEQGELHAAFRLGASGESVLLSTEGETVDRIDFGEQTTDVSLARDPDGADTWVACNSPSPGAANDCPGGLPVTPPATAEPPATPTGVPTAALTATPGGTASPTPTAATGTPGATETPDAQGSRIWLPFARRSG